MKAIWRNSVYMFKNIFRDRSFMFWELVYPIVLVIFFYTAFSGVSNMEIEQINLGIEKGNSSAYILETVDILNLLEIERENVNVLLEDETIDGFVDKDLNLLVDKSGLNQTIIKSTVDTIKQIGALGPTAEAVDFDVNYLKDQNQNSNGLVVIFYSLIAMVSAYGVFPGIEITNLVQANLTPLGARLNTVPVKKKTLLISGILVGLFVNLVSNILLLLFIQFVLKMDLIKDLAYSSIFILLGNLFGISLGIFIGSSNRKSDGFKNMLAIGLTLVLSFIAGLYSPDVKYLIESKAPIIAKLNPISTITNNLYKINLLDSTKDLRGGALLLISYSLILILCSYLFLRRRQYDSI